MDYVAVIIRDSFLSFCYFI